MMYYESIQYMYDHFLKDFFSDYRDAKTHVLNFHISHNDKDGVACNIITKYIENTQKQYNGKITNITNLNTGKLSGFDSYFKDLIRSSIYTYPTDTTTINILITDIGSFDPMIPIEFIDKGIHVNVTVIDHHKISDRNKQIIDKYYTTFDKINETYNLYYFNLTDYSAAYIYYMIYMEAFISLYQCNNIFKNYITCVCKYDIGLWGEWNDTTCADDVIEELIFRKIVTDTNSSEQINTYVNFMINNILNRIKFPFGLINTIQSSIKELNDEYYKVLENIYIVLPEDNDMPPILDKITKPNSFTYAYYTIENKKDNLQYFSLISKKILNENKNIDVLMVVNNIHHVVELRSAKDNVDVYKIAMVNGGGGHQKAAGFPLHNVEEE